MNLPTFLGGVHPPEGKTLTENKPAEILRPTDSREFVYPLALHIGAPCVPIVKKGDPVL
ncbi:MAG: electron transporter RnfC, partial [Synergistaceae bacterium]|nr:electron transporter RnfC [Synergistaceae bacterium]